METMLRELRAICDEIDSQDDRGWHSVEPLWIYKLADSVYGLVRELDNRLDTIERKIEAVEMHQREQSERYS